MNDRTRVKRRPRPAWHPLLRAASAIIAIAALTMLVAACSRGPSASPGGSTNHQHQAALAFSRCMRSHGVPQYPDPDSSGAPPKGNGPHFGVSNAQFLAAEQDCGHLLPGGTLSANTLRQCYLEGDCPQALVQQALTQGVTFARCMRSHGVPDWPDPSVDSEGRPLFNINVPRPVPSYISHAMNECSRLHPQGALLAWG